LETSSWGVNPGLILISFLSLSCTNYSDHESTFRKMTAKVISSYVSPHRA
jgi:hypothetical protein